MKREYNVYLILVLLLVFILAGCGNPKPEPGKDTGKAQSSEKIETSKTGTGDQTTQAEPSPVALAEKVATGAMVNSSTSMTYESPDGLFAFIYPEGWRQTTGESMVSFTDNKSTIKVIWTPSKIEPAYATARQVQVKALEKTEPGFKLVNIQETTLPAGKAIMINYNFDSSQVDPSTGTPSPMNALNYQLYHNEVIVAITLISPLRADNASHWASLTNSFKWLK